MAERAVLAVRDLEIVYGGTGAGVRAVNGVTLEVFENEVLGLVGESGSGKSTLAMGILGNLPAAARIAAGHIMFNGRDLRAATPAVWQAVRWRELAYIPQGAMNVLNPVRKIVAQFEDIVADRASGGDRRTWDERIVGLMKAVRLAPAVLGRYPHQLSGGMKQRVCIAMAILLEPRLIIADESTSALDVVSQKVVLETLLEVRSRVGSSVILIGHDLALQAQVADRVGIMFAGRLVEVGPVARIFDNPLHPYTRLLLAAVPSIRKQAGLPDVVGPSAGERAAWQARSELREAELGHLVAESGVAEAV